MFHDQVIAFDAAAQAGVAQQFLGQCRHEARARQPQTLEFLGIDQPPGAVVAEHELVALDDLLAGGGLRRAEVIADHLEDEVVRGQREDDHDQAALAGRVHEAVDGFFQVTLQREVAFGLALLGAPQHGIQLIDRLARHEGAQQRDGRADHGQIDVKIGTRVAEQRADFGARQHHGIDLDLQLAVGERQHQRRDAAIADQPADHEGVHAAVEHGLDQFHGFGCAAMAARLEEASDLCADAVHGRVHVAHGGAERQIGDDLAHC